MVYNNFCVPSALSIYYPMILVMYSCFEKYLQEIRGEHQICILPIYDNLTVVRAACVDLGK